MPSSQSVAGIAADAHDHQVRGQDGPVGEPDAGDSRSPSSALHAVPHSSRFRCARADSAMAVPSLVPTARSSGVGSASTIVTSSPALAGTRCDLGPDEPGADDHRAGTGVQCLAHGDGIVQGAQGVHAREVGRARAGAAPARRS